MDGKTAPTIAEYGGKPYTIKRQFLRVTGLSERSAHLWLRNGQLPDGSSLNVVQDISSKAVYVSQESIERLNNRFRFVGHMRKHSPGECKVTIPQPHQIGFVGTGSDTALIPLSKLPRAQKRFFTLGRPVLNLSTGECATLIRDPLTKELYVTSRAFNTFFGRQKKAPSK